MNVPTIKKTMLMIAMMRMGLSANRPKGRYRIGYVVIGKEPAEHWRGGHAEKEIELKTAVSMKILGKSDSFRVL